MINKKSIELVINYVVVIVLTIIVITGGFYIVTKLKKSGATLKDYAIKQARYELNQLKCGTEFLSCLTKDVVNIYNKPIAVGLRVNNRLDSEYDFQIEVVSPSSNIDITLPSSASIPPYGSYDFFIILKRKPNINIVGITEVIKIDIKYIINHELKTYSSHQITVNLK